MQITTIGLDIAKNVFQVHGIDAAEKVVVRKQLRRGQVLKFFASLQPCFNFIRDIAPVASIVRFPNVMLVNPSVPAKTVPEFIAYANANPGKLNMASPGSGSTPHVFAELFKMMTGVNMVHVPYRSVAAGMTDMLSGQVQVTFGTTASTIEYIRAGTLRAVAY